jgi:hypothetical protein
MKNLVFLFFLFILFSCVESKKLDVKSFKTGTFKTLLDANDDTSIAVRNDSIQIENYNSKIDTFAINWVNNFEYVLKKVNPKTVLDNTPFHVKITGIKENSYTFTAYYKGSNFRQTGTVIKISE